MSNAVSPQVITSLTQTLGSALSATETPESMGRALYRHLLTNAAAQGQLSADGSQIDMQVAARLTVPTSSDPTERKVRVQLCISAFGYDVACVGSVIDDGNPT